jgi:hypothetical protein
VRLLAFAGGRVLKYFARTRTLCLSLSVTQGIRGRAVFFFNFYHHHYFYLIIIVIIIIIQVAFAVGRGLSALVKGPKPEPKKPHPFAFLGYTENKKK